MLAGAQWPANRDLAVDYISIDGMVYESETEGYFRHANGKATFEGPREILYVNGTLSFDGMADDLLI